MITYRSSVALERTKGFDTPFAWTPQERWLLRGRCTGSASYRGRRSGHWTREAAWRWQSPVSYTSGSGHHKYVDCYKLQFISCLISIKIQMFSDICSRWVLNINNSWHLTLVGKFVQHWYCDELTWQFNVAQRTKSHPYAEHVIIHSNCKCFSRNALT